LFRRLPQEMQSWLPELAVLDVWTTQAVQEVACEVPSDWLKKVVSFGLPILVIDFEKYQPHSVLIEFLDKTLRKNITKYKEMQKITAEYEKKHGNIIKSVKSYVLAEKYREAEDVLISFTDFASLNGEIGLQKNAFELIPESKLSEKALILLAARRFAAGEANKAEKTLREFYERGNKSFLLLINLGIIENKKGNGNARL
jgi:ATP/maltotriose-dependent transcriptional regulator MalT